MLDSFNHQDVVDLWGRRRWKYSHKPIVGLSGGILVGWNKESIELLDIEVQCFFVSLRCRWIEYSFKWMFSGIYGAQDASSKGLCGLSYLVPFSDGPLLPRWRFQHG